LKLECRAADDLEHVRGGGLLLQRFVQLVEQPGVLDGNDSLTCEVLDQLDMLVREWQHFLAKDGNCAKEVVFFQHWHDEKRSSAGEISHRNKRRVFFEVEASALMSAMCNTCFVAATRASG
jgi:hypothetical protein